MSLAITDHALNRLFERGRSSAMVAALCAGHGPIREAISARLERASNAAARLGLSSYHITLDGLRFVIKDGAVITVMDGDWAHRARRNGIARP